MIYVNSVISYILGNLCYCTIRLHLILVLMEDTLRGNASYTLCWNS